MRILIINGPNLNLIGIREKSIYGERGFDSYIEELKSQFKNIELSYFQSNHEGELIDKIHAEGFVIDAIILNAGAYTHTSVALADAISAIKAPVVEVHISNVAGRESFRHHSFIASKCIGTITGFGLDSYRLGIEAILKKLSN